MVVWAAPAAYSTPGTRSGAEREAGTNRKGGTMSLLKNGGWRGIGEFATIRKTIEINGQTVQVVSFNRQLDQNGVRRSREYYELRTKTDVVVLGAAVKSVKSAIAEAEARYA